MSYITLAARRRAIAAALLAGAIMFVAPPVASAQQVVAFVDGQPITALDIEHRAKFIQMSTQKVAPRQEVIDGLIDEILEVLEAKHFGISVPDSEVDTAYSHVAEGMGVDAKRLTDILVHGGSSAGTLKHRLRAQLAWTALVRGRFKASLEIPDSDVEAQLLLHQPDEKKSVGYEYTVRPVVFLVPRRSPDAAYEARKREADALRARFETCAAGISFARALKEVAVGDQMVKFSADLPQQSRDILDGTAVGHLTPPDQTSDGIQMFAVCARKESTTDTPDKKKIRDEMFQKKFGAQADRYLKELRRAAMIEYK
jgi:peptidyl-prolyl cis-trans isomerase SurA